MKIAVYLISVVLATTSLDKRGWLSPLCDGLSCHINNARSNVARLTNNARGQVTGMTTKVQNSFNNLTSSAMTKANDFTAEMTYRYVCSTSGKRTITSLASNIISQEGAFFDLFCSETGKRILGTFIPPNALTTKLSGPLLCSNVAKKVSVDMYNGRVIQQAVETIADSTCLPQNKAMAMVLVQTGMTVVIAVTKAAGLGTAAIVQNQILASLKWVYNLHK